jgi:hypothetical protein
MDTIDYIVEAYFAWFLFVGNVIAAMPESSGIVVVTAWSVHLLSLAISVWLTALGRPWKAEFLSVRHGFKFADLAAILNVF